MHVDKITEVLNEVVPHIGFSAIREGWEQAKKEKRLSGCGLMGNLTMDEIDEFDCKLSAAKAIWPKLAGIPKEENPEIAKLKQEILLLTEERNKLRNAVIDATECLLLEMNKSKDIT